MNMFVKEVYRPKNLVGSANIYSAAGSLIGIWVSSASGTPTIAVYDSATTTTDVPIVGAFTPSPGFNPMPFSFDRGCYVVITGTVNCTVGYIAQ